MNKKIKSEDELDLNEKTIEDLAKDLRQEIEFEQRVEKA